MTKQTILSEEAPPALPVFAHATISGKTVYVSGSIGVDKEFKLQGDIKGQTKAALENMSKILKSAGTDINGIVKVNIFLSNLKDDFAPMNEVYGEFFPKHSHSRTCVGVAVLPLGAAIEIECIAELP
ncbi:Endoribonuclease L-PSP [Daedalea quercina L-15889]|uniref:Endoribonuclease L-PSP n=1 Tax=Daedalea quercina L-15889 TaxID=1314783 RepID=A0A165TUH0_9APHY|nr:Endoribonuclease L-PSP [Daedalea quercina L-15889]